MYGRTDGFTVLAPWASLTQSRVGGADEEGESRSSEMIGLAVRVWLFLPRPVRGLSRPPVVQLVSALTPACIWRRTVLQTFLKLAASRASVPRVQRGTRDPRGLGKLRRHLSE